MITIENASIYSTEGSIAYQIDYSNGTSVRAVESSEKIIRNEYKTPSGWVQAGKAYKVVHDHRRQGEKIKAAVMEFCK